MHFHVHVFNPAIFIQPWVISITPICQIKTTNIYEKYDLLKYQGL